MTTPSAPAAVRRIAKNFSGVIGVAACDLNTGEEVLLNADLVFPTASMVKIGILLELLRQREAGKLELSEPLTVRKTDKTAGSGLLENMSDEVTLPLHDIAVLMNAISDNTATNVLIDRLGRANINRAMRAAGMTHTRLYRKIVFSAGRKLKYPNFATGTPRDFMTLMTRLYAGQLLNPANSEAMLDIMRVQKNMGNLTRYIAFNPYGRDQTAWVASKTGSINGVRNETGILHSRRGAHVVSVMTKRCTDKRWTPDNEGTVAVAKMSKAIADHFHNGY
ncbi:MAG: serine hydrolase [Chloroflexi bacterium]|nr:serine hydrolase [Chloroflexota bacterium]MBI3732494.1 serine hydrolase [Chloroflexota bacterium]